MVHWRVKRGGLPRAAGDRERASGCCARHGWSAAHRRIAALTVLAALIGCDRGVTSPAWDAAADGGSDVDAEPTRDAAGPDDFSPPSLDGPDALEDFPRGAEQHAEVCKRSGDDRVRQLFCADGGADIEGIDSFAALLDALGMSVGSDEDLGPHRATEFALTGHSTALTTRSVSAINPRVIFSQTPSEDRELLGLAFARGEQFTELVTRDYTTKELRFSIISFRQACNERTRGCAAGDLLTPSIEVGWRDVTLYEEEDLKNTTLDCRQCHQPQGPGTKRLLRMQELRFPWTHWFDSTTPGGMALFEDYDRAKLDETFAGLTRLELQRSSPAAITSLVVSTDPQDAVVVQPNQFDSTLIELEVMQSAPAQPFDNSLPGTSATWQEIYEASKRGEAIPAPYHDVKVTDADKLAQAAGAYRDHLDGDLARQDLPDIRDGLPGCPRPTRSDGLRHRTRPRRSSRSVASLRPLPQPPTRPVPVPGGISSSIWIY